MNILAEFLLEKLCLDDALQSSCMRMETQVSLTSRSIVWAVASAELRTKVLLLCQFCKLHEDRPVGMACVTNMCFLLGIKP